MSWRIGVDIGGTGARLTAVRDDGLTYTRPGPRVEITKHGSSAARSIEAMVRDLIAAHPTLVHEGVDAFAAGMTGMVTLVPDPESMYRLVADLTGARTCALAADILTGHLGALGGQPGAVLTAGTGAIALGTDLADTWIRVDGWGHLIGDLGAGSWIGMEALRAAAADLDGRGDGTGELARRAQLVFGPLEAWPSQLYTRDDRAGRMAGFAAEAAEAAAQGDRQAREILDRAGAHLASTLAAALGQELPPRAAYSGGLFRLGEVLTVPFLAAFARLVPDVVPHPGSGSPLDGALELATRLRDGAVREHPPLLRVYTRRRDTIAVSVRPALAGTLDDLVRQGMRQREYSAVRLAVAFGGRVEVDLAAGVEQRYRDLERRPVQREARVAVRKDTVFDLASCTKPYVALTALTLLHRHGFDLSQPASTWLDLAPAAQAVTVGELLTHTSGLPAEWLGWREPRPIERYWDEISRIEPVGPPGEYLYSCVGYLWLGRVVEALAGVGLDAAVKRVLLDPLHLRSTRYRPPGSWPIAATEWQADRGMIRGDVHDEAAWALGGVAGNAGLFAAAPDVLAFAEALRTADKRLDPWAVEVATSDQLGGEAPVAGGIPGAVRAGAGLRIGDPRWMVEASAFGHTGFTGTAMLVDRDREISVVLLTNRVHPTRAGADPNQLRRRVIETVMSW